MVNVATGTVCTGTLGTVKNVCLVKCQNPAGPFGGVVPFQMASGGGGGGAAAGSAKGAKGAPKANNGAKGANADGKKQGRWIAVDF